MNTDVLEKLEHYTRKGMRILRIIVCIEVIVLIIKSFMPDKDIDE